ncbi:hypothetical protein [Nodularia sp. UHCC 0506]|uniref:hypothetical protein n=1 Tax=Nodularia sp. UHCC 0506 TaxID=3110243 RepID=UPI002B202B10|nr:hypothetical protein [Nodularia sp. UHCC 0506]MEA5516237.1 hypothetical protein [Nodularia sp. UHCC 0506]
MNTDKITVFIDVYLWFGVHFDQRLITVLPTPHSSLLTQHSALSTQEALRKHSS